MNNPLQNLPKNPSQHTDILEQKGVYKEIQAKQNIVANRWEVRLLFV